VVKNSSVKIQKEIYIYIYWCFFFKEEEVWINEFKEAKDKVPKEVEGKTTY
jgi:hypothetical protein